MSSPSAIGAVIDALVAVWRGSPTFDGDVYDGFPNTTDAPNLAVYVGVQDANGDSTEAATSVQGWAWLGHSQRDETVVVHCCIRAWNGDGDTKGARDAALGAMTTLTDALQAAPDLAAGGGVIYSPGITTASLSQCQYTEGSEALLPFDVTVRARLG